MTCAVILAAYGGMRCTLTYIPYELGIMQGWHFFLIRLNAIAEGLSLLRVGRVRTVAWTWSMYLVTVVTVLVFPYGRSVRVAMFVTAILNYACFPRVTRSRLLAGLALSIYLWSFI